jgi:multiple antibiotic resistance protein
MLIASLSFSLFLLLDPVGNIPVFLAHLKGLSPKRQRQIIFRELLIALAVIYLFMFLGQPLLHILNIDHHSVFISGGVILFIIALKMIFPKDDENHLSKTTKEPFIVPLAIPLVAGPAILASLILYSAQVPSLAILSLAIIIAWGLSVVILLFSSNLSQLLGIRGILACERLMGLILTLIAVQMFFNGIHQFLNGEPSGP